MQTLVLVLLSLMTLNIILVLASLNTWFERKVSALMQDRIGANRAGSYVTSKDIATPLLEIFPSWIVTPLRVVFLIPISWAIRQMGILGMINTFLCDAVKAIFKEDFIPEGSSKFLHALAPFMAVVPVFVAFAFLPLAPEFTLFEEQIRPQIVPVETSLLFVFAMGSIAVYGVAIAGFTGNNKFSLLGALRATAQMISYELAMGLCFVTLVIGFGTLDLHKIVLEQSSFWHWGVFALPFGPLTLVVLFIVGMAETKRAPFDLPEAESELAAGYFTEYSGMKFLLFWLGEFAEIALFSFLIAILFFGGWHIPFVTPATLGLPDSSWQFALLGHLVLIGKVVAISLFQVTVRWTLPRFRYDQLMNLGWKILLPVSLVNLVVTALYTLLVR